MLITSVLERCTQVWDTFPVTMFPVLQTHQGLSRFLHLHLWYLTCLNPCGQSRYLINWIFMTLNHLSRHKDQKLTGNIQHDLMDVILRWHQWSLMCLNVTLYYNQFWLLPVLQRMQTMKHCVYNGQSYALWFTE